jgi:N-acetylmuramoyl-L-alanine amidase
LPGIKLRLIARTIIALAALGISGIGETAPPRPSITGLKITTTGDATRVVISLSHRVDFRAFTLAQPHRVVLDSIEVAWGAAADPGARPRGLIAGVRYGRFEPGASRIVLDLAGPARIRSLDFSGGEGRATNLLVDLEPVSDDSFQQDVRRVVGPNAGPVAGPLVAPVAGPVAGPVTGPTGGFEVASLRPKAPIARPREEARPIISIDPGHGGVDRGATSRTGEAEKDITLAVARELRRRLLISGRYRVVLTRETDTTLRLEERVEIARKAGSELFVSLHADAHPASSMQGLSIYTLSETASDADTAAYALRENKADIVAGIALAEERPEVANILLDLARRETGNLSSEFAGLLVEEFSRGFRMVPNPHRFAGFAVLRAPDVPSVLLELGYLSNPEDERLLRQPIHQGRLADRIVRAIDQYFVRKTRSARL